MESLARVFSSSSASRFPTALRAELTATEPLFWEEALYASYIKRVPGSYTHNPTRASIAITPGARLVVLAAGHKQIDISLNDRKFRNGLQIWAEKSGQRIHFKLDLGYYGTDIGGSSLEIRVETKRAGQIMMIIENGVAQQGANAKTHAPPLHLNPRSSVVSQPKNPLSSMPTDLLACFPDFLRSEILASNPMVFEEGLPASTVLRTPAKSFKNTTKASIAITQSFRLVIVPQGESYVDFPLTISWCRNALEVWLEDEGRIIVFEIQTGPFQPESNGEVREIRIRTASAKRIENIIKTHNGQAARFSAVNELPAGQTPRLYAVNELPTGQTPRFSVVNELPTGQTPRISTPKELPA